MWHSSMPYSSSQQINHKLWCIIRLIIIKRSFKYCEIWKLFAKSTNQSLLSAWGYFLSNLKRLCFEKYLARLSRGDSVAWKYFRNTLSHDNNLKVNSRMLYLLWQWSNHKTKWNQWPLYRVWKLFIKYD